MGALRHPRARTPGRGGRSPCTVSSAVNRGDLPRFCLASVNRRLPIRQDEAQLPLPRHAERLPEQLPWHPSLTPPGSACLSSCPWAWEREKDHSLIRISSSCLCRTFQLDFKPRLGKRDNPPSQAEVDPGLGDALRPLHSPPGLAQQACPGPHGLETHTVPRAFGIIPLISTATTQATEGSIASFYRLKAHGSWSLW